MATTINAGRIRFVSRGTYNNSTQYYLFDLVDYNGSSYIAKENTFGNLPTNTQYWQLIAEKGNTGSTGQTGPVGPTGNGIASITKTGTSGLVDTYTITYTNGNTTTFTVTNGEDANITRTEFEELKQENEDLKNNQLTGEEIGQSIYLSDSADSRVRSIGLSGNSEQESTTGKNLGNTKILKSYNNPTVINVSENGFTVDLSKGNFGLLVGKDIMLGDLDGSKQYTLSYHLKQNNTVFLPSLQFKYSDGTYTSKQTATLESDVKITSTAGKTITAIEPTFSTQSGGGLAVFSNIQLEEGSTATSYEPYTGGEASPNPSYPQEIHSTGDSGSVNEKVQNKNLFDLKEYLIDRGIPYTENEDGSLTFTLSQVLYDNPLKFSNEDITVSLSGNVTNGTATNTRLEVLKDDGSIAGEINASKVKVENISSSKIRFNWSTAGTVTMKNIQLEQGTTATDYVAHEEQDISFPLAEGQKLMQGDYLADDGIHHKMGEVVFDGTENWTNYASNYDGRFYCTTKHFGQSSGYLNTSKFKCTHFTPATSTSATNGISSTLYATYIKADIEGVTSPETFKTWLSSHNVKVQYELAEEVIDPYTEEQQAVWEQIKALRTYKPVTHISSTDEVPATVDITYVKDWETVINNLSN